MAENGNISIAFWTVAGVKISQHVSVLTFVEVNIDRRRTVHRQSFSASVIDQ
jgi:hypothetical protein